MPTFRKIRNILGTILLLCVLVAASFGTFFIFTIRTVSLTGVSRLKGLDHLRGKNILLLSEQKLEDDLHAQNASVDTVRVKKDYPDSLSISAEKAHDVGSIQTKDGYLILNSSYRVSKKVYGAKVPPGLVPVTYYQPLSNQSVAVGDSLSSPEVETSIFQIISLEKLGITIASVDIVNFYMILLHSDTGDIIITSEKSKEEQYEIIKEALRQLKISNKKIKSIDVRFDKPIIRLLENT